MDTIIEKNPIAGYTSCSPSCAGPLATFEERVSVDFGCAFSWAKILTNVYF